MKSEKQTTTSTHVPMNDGMSVEEIKQKVDKEVKESIKQIDPVIRYAMQNVPVPSVMQTKEEETEGIWHILPHQPHTSHVKPDNHEPMLHVFEVHDMQVTDGKSYLCNAHIRHKPDTPSYLVEQMAHARAMEIMPALIYHEWRLFEYDEHGDLQPYGALMPCQVEMTPKLFAELREKKREEDAYNKERWQRARNRIHPTISQRLEAMTQKEREVYQQKMSRQSLRYQLTRMIKRYLADKAEDGVITPRRKRFLKDYMIKCYEEGVITREQLDKHCKRCCL